MTRSRITVYTLIAAVAALVILAPSEEIVSQTRDQVYVTNFPDPQTVEHLQILRLLQLDVGLIALTKCDLSEPDWIDLVEEEVRDLVADTFLADAPIVRTSAAESLNWSAPSECPTRDQFLISYQDAVGEVSALLSTVKIEETERGVLVRDEVRYIVPGGALIDRLFVQRDLTRIFAFRQSQLARHFASSI